MQHSLTVRHTRRLLCLNSGGGVVHLLREGETIEDWLDGTDRERGRERAQTNRTTDLDFSALDNGGVQGLPRRVGVRAVCECHEAESLKRRRDKGFHAASN